MRCFAARAAVLLVCGLFGCSSGGGTGVDAAGDGGSTHAGAGGGGGAASGGAGGSAGARGQAGNGASGGASGGGRSGSQGSAGTTGVGGAPQPNGCNVDYNCPQGETCEGPGGANFGCVPSGTGKAGDACDVTSTTIICGDQLVCAAITNSTGNCYQYCDSGHVCPTGTTCTTFGTQADQFLNLCV
jgi:hypothetical protein